MYFRGYKKTLKKLLGVGFEPTRISPDDLKPSSLLLASHNYDLATNSDIPASVGFPTTYHVDCPLDLVFFHMFYQTSEKKCRLWDSNPRGLLHANLSRTPFRVYRNYDIKTQNLTKPLGQTDIVAFTTIYYIVLSLNLFSSHEELRFCVAEALVLECLAFTRH